MARPFPRAVRLLRRVEFEAVYKGGRRRSSPQFAIFFRPNGALGGTTGAARNSSKCSRFGSSVKKALGGAVVRNRIRRRIREILRLHMPEIPTGWDIVIHPRATVARSDFSPLAVELIGLLRSALK